MVGIQSSIVWHIFIAHTDLEEAEQLAYALSDLSSTDVDEQNTHSRSVYRKTVAILLSRAE